jgi:hypothetical protein
LNNFINSFSHFIWITTSIDMLIHRSQWLSIRNLISRALNNRCMITTGSNISCKITRSNVRDMNPKGLPCEEPLLLVLKPLRRRINGPIRQTHISSNRSNIIKPDFLYAFVVAFITSIGPEEVSLKVIFDLFKVFLPMVP